jgi:hypothetical protein
MIGRFLEWLGRPKTVYTNNLSYFFGEFCFWYAIVDVIRIVWF